MQYILIYITDDLLLLITIWWLKIRNVMIIIYRYCIILFCIFCSRELTVNSYCTIIAEKNGSTGYIAYWVMFFFFAKRASYRILYMIILAPLEVNSQFIMNCLLWVSKNLVLMFDRMKKINILLFFLQCKLCYENDDKWTHFN